jgi:tRNA(fMet)-specific endonuclease VapC
MRYLLDTNILSEAIKSSPNSLVMEMLERHQDEIVTASPVWHELQFGCMRLPISSKRLIIEAYLKNVISRTMEILPYDQHAAMWHAKERARLSLEGRTPPFVDGQIAAISSVHGLTLVTRNIKDFDYFSDLKLQNWHSTLV